MKSEHSKRKDKGFAKVGGFLEEFHTFIARGNVLDLAVGVIVGGAFTAIVNSLVKDILMPLIGIVLMGVDFTNLMIRVPVGNHPMINIGNFLQSLVTFLLTALSVFVFVKFINLFERKKLEDAKIQEPEELEGFEAPEEAEISKEVELLQEIRDLMAKKE